MRGRRAGGPRFVVVYGTRPEMIKLAGLVRRLGPAALLVHTRQHYDLDMDEGVAAGMGLRAPDVSLSVGGLSRGRQVAAALADLDALLRARRVDAVIVQGDTNATLAGALAANAAGVPLVHIEAGLRSYDRGMPEEHNRVVADHLADLLCAPTPVCVGNLAREGIGGGRVVCTGNTVVEAVRDQLPAPGRRLALLDLHGLRSEGYVLATIHRPENTDDPRVLAGILGQLGRLPLPVLLPVHPRTAAAVRRHGLEALLDGIRVLGPLGPGDFLGLAAHAALLVSDSGGVQEECTVLKRPLIVVRRSTERPESLAGFAWPAPGGDGLAELAAELLGQGDALRERLGRLPSPYGDHTAADQILGHLMARAGAAALVPADSTEQM